MSVFLIWWLGLLCLILLYSEWDYAVFKVPSKDSNAILRLPITLEGDFLFHFLNVKKPLPAGYIKSSSGFLCPCLHHSSALVILLTETIFLCVLSSHLQAADSNVQEAYTFMAGYHLLTGNLDKGAEYAQRCLMFDEVSTLM